MNDVISNRTFDLLHSCGTYRSLSPIMHPVMHLQNIWQNDPEYYCHRYSGIGLIRSLSLHLEGNYSSSNSSPRDLNGNRVPWLRSIRYCEYVLFRLNNYKNMYATWWTNKPATVHPNYQWVIPLRSYGRGSRGMIRF